MGNFTITATYTIIEILSEPEVFCATPGGRMYSRDVRIKWNNQKGDDTVIVEIEFPTIELAESIKVGDIGEATYNLTQH